MSSGSVIKSIQKGALVIPDVGSNPVSKDISIATVVPEKCFVIVQSNIGDTNETKFWTESRLKELKQNSLTIMIRTASTVSGYSMDCQVSWQVIEFY